MPAKGSPVSSRQVDVPQVAGAKAVLTLRATAVSTLATTVDVACGWPGRPPPRVRGPPHRCIVPGRGVVGSRSLRDR